ncbi:MAG: DUF4136 domain-containing protein [Trichloromonas sp.]|jgi:hypothetical protein|nr:DUF4136 domain-containing protein [Trichloromonas sp.]
MKNSRWLPMLLLLVLLAACAKPMSVSSSFDGKADFDSYRTWFWVDGKPALMDALLGDDMTDQFIRRAVSEELTGKGLAVQADEPDLLVRYTTRIREAVAAQPGDLGYSYQWRWIREGVGRGQAESAGRGFLHIELIDRRAGTLVWQGTVSGGITDERDAQGKIPNAVKKIFEQYPPKR